MKVDINSLNQVVYTEHVHEFVRFYKHHQKLNEEIAGLREKRFYEFGTEKVIIIKRDNFWIGLKTLQAFIIDNIHYVKRYSDVNSVLSSFDKLEEDFTEDEEYSKLSDKVHKGLTLNPAEDIEFNLKYLSYLVRCFELGYKLNMLLQTTLMINIKNQKDLIFRDEGQFFESLANYRNFLVDDLANFRVKNTLEHFKRVLGYYYTYKVLFLEDETKLMDRLIIMLYELIISEDAIKIIKEAQSINHNKLYIKRFGVKVKFALCKIYSQTNSFLSERNILPKRKSRENMDFTLI
jgi:hypothetical protein